MSDTTDTIPATLSEAEARARLAALGYERESIDVFLRDPGEAIFAFGQYGKPHHRTAGAILRAFVAGQAAAPSQPAACPNANKCHGPESWCDVCGNVGNVCDAGQRCDRHRESTPSERADAARNDPQPAQGASLEARARLAAACFYTGDALDFMLNDEHSRSLWANVVRAVDASRPAETGTLATARPPHVEHESRIEKAIGMFIGGGHTAWNGFSQGARDRVWTSLRWLVDVTHGLDLPEPFGSAAEAPASDVFGALATARPALSEERAREMAKPALARVIGAGPAAYALKAVVDLMQRAASGEFGGDGAPGVESGSSDAMTIAHASEALTEAGFAPMFDGESLADRIARLVDELKDGADQ